MAKKKEEKVQEKIEEIAGGMTPGGFLVLLCVIAIIVFGVYVWTLKPSRAVVNAGDAKIHVMTLGNKYAGDCILIQTESTDILVDAGSKASSVSAITNYINSYVTDGKLEYVIATHAHEDHIACFAINDGSLFDLYECEVIIDFPRTNSTSATYTRYQSERDAEIAAGAEHYTALDCIESGQTSYTIGKNTTLEILDNYYYTHNSSSENNYSVCFVIRQGTKTFLFTGDLEENGEEWLVENNNIGEVEFYKAGHHGSNTSSSVALLSVIKPKYVAVSCVAGTSEYTDTEENKFPTQQFIDNIAPYTNKVYVTSQISTNAAGYEDMNGNIILLSTKSETSVNCSNNNTLLKDTEWFAAKRTMPTAWA